MVEKQATVTKNPTRKRSLHIRAHFAQRARYKPTSWAALVNFRIAHYSSNRRIPSGLRYSDYITMGWFRFPSA
jgi:hypothetical protein